MCGCRIARCNYGAVCRSGPCIALRDQALERQTGPPSPEEGPWYKLVPEQSLLVREAIDVAGVVVGSNPFRRPLWKEDSQTRDPAARGKSSPDSYNPSSWARARLRRSGAMSGIGTDFR